MKKGLYYDSKYDTLFELISSKKKSSGMYELFVTFGSSASGVLLVDSSELKEIKYIGAI